MSNELRDYPKNAIPFFKYKIMHKNDMQNMLLSLFPNNEYERNEITSIIDTLFSCFIFAENIKDEDYYGLSSWGHIDISDMDKIWYKIRIDRDNLLWSVEEYKKELKFKNEKIDFMLVDMLIFSEYLAFFCELKKKELSKGKYFNIMFGSDIGFWDKYSTAIVWMIIVIFAFIFTPLSVIIFIFWLISFGVQFYTIKKMSDILLAMQTTYEGLNSKDWRVIWDDMQYSRRNLAVWDSVAFDIVKRNLKD